jgi:GNAT superfamily N-acetyltransferase
MTVRVRPLVDTDRPWVRDLVEGHWGLPVVTPAAVYAAPEQLEGMIAEIGGAHAGAVTYARTGGEWEIVVVISAVQGAGVGRAMLEAVRGRAERAGARRVWLITTDDTGAAPFYERLGMVRTRVHEDFVSVVRRAKPATGGYRDAYELEWRLGPP